MIFTAVQQNILSNGLVVFGKTDESDLTIQDTGYIGDMDRILFDDPMDFTIKFIQEIGNSITVSMSKISNEFHVVYRSVEYVNFGWTKLFVQETINRRIELEQGRV